MSGGLITITFDDGYLNLYENGFSVMKKHGLEGVVFVITGLAGKCFGGSKLMKVSHLKTLASAGWEIGSHSVSHVWLTILAPEALDVELRESKKWGEDNGFSMVSVAYPYGEFNEQVQQSASKYYNFCRTTVKGLNEYDANKQLRAVSLWEDVEDCKRWADRAKAEDKWLVLTAHGVVASEAQLPPRNEDMFGWITKSKFEEFIKYVNASGIPVKTFAEVMGKT